MKPYDVLFELIGKNVQLQINQETIQGKVNPICLDFLGTVTGFIIDETKIDLNQIISIKPL